MIAQQKKSNIFLIGPMGAGKTTIGKRLAQELQLEFYDTDKVVEQCSGVPIPWIFDFEGEEGFRKREHQILEELSLKSGIVLATGGGIILNPQNRLLLTTRGQVIYLSISLETQIERVIKSRDRPLIRASTDLHKTLEDLRIKRNPLYEEIADYVVVTDHSSIQAIVKTIVSYIQD